MRSSPLLCALLGAACIASLDRTGAAAPAPGAAAIGTLVYQDAPWGETRGGLIKWAPDGRLFSVATLMELQIRDGVTGEVRASIPEDINGHLWTRDGKHVAAALPDGGLLLLRIADGTTRRLPPPQADLRCAWFGQRGCPLLGSEDGTHLALPVERGVARWDLTQGTAAKISRERDIQSLATDGKEIFLLDFQGYHRFDLATGAARGSVGASGSIPERLAPSTGPGGARLAVAYLGSVVSYDLQTGQPLFRVSPFGTSSVTGIAWSPGGDTLVATTREKAAFLKGQGQARAVQLDHDEGGPTEAPGVTFSRDGRRVAIDCDDALLLFDPRSGALLRKVPGHGAMAPDGGRAVVLDRAAGEFALVGLATGGRRALARMRQDLKRRLSPAGDRLLLDGAVIDLGRGVILPEGGEVEAEDDPKVPDLDHAEIKAASRPSPDGKEVVGNKPCPGSRFDECPCLFNLASGKCRVELPEARSASVKRTFRFSPDGKLLSYRAPAFGSAVQIYDVATGKRVRVLPGRANAQAFVAPGVLISVGPTFVPQLTRLSDGATLRLLLRRADDDPDGAPRLLLLRDDGRFDGDAEVLQHVLRRSAPDLRAPLQPLSQQANLRQPGLYRAFLAGAK